MNSDVLEDNERQRMHAKLTAVDIEDPIIIIIPTEGENVGRDVEMVHCFDRWSKRC